MKISSIKEAESYICGILRNKGYGILKTKPVNFIKEYNKFTHCIVVVEKNNVVESFYILFKRNPFFTFAKQFNLGEHGFGESINFDAFKAIERSSKLDRILFVYGDGVVYSVDKGEWGGFVRDNDTVRMTSRHGETTTSVSIKLMNRWDEVMGNTQISDFIKNKR